MIAPGSSHQRKKTIQGTILWSKKGKNVLDEMVEMRRQKVSEDKRTTLEIEIHRCLAHVENPEERDEERDEATGKRIYSSRSGTGLCYFDRDS